MNNELQNLLNSFGSTERFLIGKEPYKAKTVAKMAEDIATDIQDAITALENNEESKMVRKVRNGYRVKVGYGAIARLDGQAQKLDLCPHRSFEEAKQPGV